MNVNRVIQTLTKHKLEILLLLALVFIAFGMYSIPSQTYPNINEFDPFYHARVVRELVQTGSIPEWEFMSYWPEGMAMYSWAPHLWHYVLASAYWAVALLTTGSFAYSKELFVKVVSWVMPFVGAFGVLSMYFLGKEIRGKKAGLFAALLFMVQSNFMYKTMFAEIEEDALGISLFVFTLFAYVYALKRGGWKNGLFAGFAMSLLLLAWSGVVYAAALVSLVAAWHGLKAILNKEWDNLDKTTEAFGISLIPVAILGFLFTPSTSNVIYTVGVMGGATTLLVLANYWFNYHKSTTSKKVFGINKKQLMQVLTGVIVIGALIGGAIYGPAVVNKTIGATQLGTSDVRLYYTVAEQHTVTFENIISGLGLLGVFGVFALAYFPIRLLLKWKEMNNFDMVAAAFMITSMFLFISQNKMHYFFAPASVLAIGIVLADIINISKKLGKWPKRLAVIGILLLLFSQIGIGFIQMEQMKASYPIQDGWFKTMDWLQTTPEDTAFLTWWDYGHWTAFLGERHAIVDNSNINHTKVEVVADIFTEFRGNSTLQLEERVLPQLKAFQVTHVGVDRVLLYSKWGALTYIADRQCIPTKTLDTFGLSFPELTEISKSTCGYGYTYSGEIGMTNCKKNVISSEFATEISYSCNFIQDADLQFTEEEWAEIKSTPWPGYDLTISTPDGNPLRLRVYGQPDDKLMYFHAGNRLLYDAPINYMYGFRVFFKDPSFEYHELVENEFVPNEEVVVQKVAY